MIPVFILILNIYNLLKHRKNIYFFIMLLIILYFNYSICIGEYLFDGNQVSMFQYLKVSNRKNYYQEGIVILFIFTLLYTLFLNNNIKIENIKFQYKSNNFIFILLLIFLLYIFIFKFDRTSSESYEVKISPMYEYSYIIFLFAIHYSNTKIKKVIVCIFVLVFILQDILYGGRITSLQLLLLVSITFFCNFLTIKKIIIFFFSGIFLLSLVGSYRAHYSLSDINLTYFINIIKNKLFILDTATFAYGASITHLYSIQFTTFTERFISFINFLLYIPFGDLFSMSDILIRDTITSINSFTRSYYFNYNGGLIISYFYFWLGWFGVFLAGLLVPKYILFFLKQKSELGFLIFICIIVTVPRWYLYNPITLFRGPLFFLPLVFSGIYLIELLTIAIKKKNNNMK